MKEKVIAYILSCNHKTLLVHTHRDFPEAGIQVPAGTVEMGESLTSALLREIEEEAGLTELTLLRKLGASFYTRADNGEKQLRHFYLLEAPRNIPKFWDHAVTGHGLDNGLVFSYQWMPVLPAPQLAAEQGIMLGFI